MSGVLKDILLVLASMAIFRDPVTGQQYFGYSIALGGLVYYRLGAERIQSLAPNVLLQLGELRQNHPTMVRVVALGALGVCVIGLCLYGPNMLGEYARYPNAPATMAI